MWQGTTPTIEIKTNINLTPMAQVQLTIEDRKGNRLTINQEELTISEDTVTFQLSQKESLSLSPGRVRLQLRVKTNDGDVLASNIMLGDLQYPVYEGEL